MGKIRSFLDRGGPPKIAGGRWQYAPGRGWRIPFAAREATMSTAIKAVRPRRTKAARSKLTDYESEQVEQIAAWKSKPPNPIDEMAKKITGPVAHLVEKIVPEAPVRAGIERAYEISQRLAGQDDIKQQAGVTDLAALRNKPLEECDQLAFRVSLFANGLALAEGLATGAGGFLTTLIDGPLLFVLTLRTIIRIGHCYGYALDHRRDQAFVLGIYLTATSGTLHTKRRRLEELRELEELLICETQREVRHLGRLVERRRDAPG
jgi:hypothetical protein